jgi:cytochrome c oxidase cbb3-type subunit 3
MQASKKIYILTAFALIISPAFCIAAETNPQDKAGNYNMALITLVSLMLILLFVIGMLASVLKQLSFAIRDRKRKERESSSSIVKSVLLFLVMTIPAFHTIAEEKAAKVAAPVAQNIAGMAETDFYTITGFILLEIIIIFALMMNINSLIKAIRKSPELQAKAEAAIKKSWFWDKFNAAASMEKEKDILLDHNYDGIQELDNSLPPWWKYGFYLTIIVGCIYIYRYHISHDGPSQQEEYAAEMQKGEEDKAAYLATSANNIDENNVVMLTDGGAIAEGKDLFSKNCAACHLADGGGVVGPNLTDDYWLHGGSIKDVFKSIKYGWQDKGMKSWKDDFSPKQIQELASFVKSLKGTHPAAPKAPQGDLYIEGGKTPTADSTKTDSTKTAKVAVK